MSWLNDFVKVTSVTPVSKILGKKTGLIKEDTPAAAGNNGQLDIDQILQSIYGPRGTDLQLNSLGTMLRGNFDPQSFSSANPDTAQEYQAMISSGELNPGTTLQDFARSKGQDPNQYYSGGLMDLTSQATRSATGDQTDSNTFLRASNVSDLQRLGPQARTAWQAANPEYASFTSGMLGQLNELNSRPTPQISTQYANGGPLLSQISRDAGRNLNRVSPIQQQLEQQAKDQLGTNGGLTAQDLY